MSPREELLRELCAMIKETGTPQRYGFVLLLVEQHADGLHVSTGGTLSAEMLKTVFTQCAGAEIVPEMVN